MKTIILILAVVGLSAAEADTDMLVSLISRLLDASKRGDYADRETRREVCPPVYETGKEHNGHVQYCKQDSECDRGQFCCFFGDTDAKICRLGVPKESQNNKGGLVQETCRPFPPGHNPDHTYHTDRCYQDSECGRGQKCCFWGDSDAKICRLTVESAAPEVIPDDESKRPEGVTCPPVYVFNRDHDDHVDRCYADSQCGRGQLCCFFGDTDAKICRLQERIDKEGERDGNCRPPPPGHQSDHSFHTDRCYQDNECRRGQKCCHWGDDDAKICRLTVENVLYKK